LFSPTIQAVYDPLFMVDAEDLEPQPWLATSWEQSEDGKTLDLTLRDDIEFADGTHMDAEGVERFFDAVLTSGKVTLGATLVDIFETQVTATGDDTIQITTAKPMNSVWWWHFSLMPVGSAAALDDPEGYAAGPVGSGPYSIESEVADASVTFVKNENYWNADVYPYDRVTVATYSDPVAALNALKTGQLDAAQLTTELADEAEASGLSVVQGVGTIGAIEILDVGGRLVPALGDVRVRRAMNMAFDQESILENLNHGYGIASTQPYAKGQPEYVEGGDDRYAYDPETAKELLAEAGYPDGFDLTIITSAAAGTAGIEPIAVQSLEDIGIRVTLQPIAGEYPEFGSATTSGEYPARIFNFAATAWDLNPAFNWGDNGFTSPEYDAIIAAHEEGTPAEQAEAAQKLGELYLDQAWFVPFSWPSAIFATTPDVHVVVNGFYSNPKLYLYTPAG
jgi:peptide/nickel transport system substrate-binding protein